jgi:hypothetical protein
VSPDVLRRLEADVAPSLELAQGARGGGAGRGRAGAGPGAQAWRRLAWMMAGRVAPVLACALAVGMLVPPLLMHVSVRVAEVRLGYELSAAAATLAELRGENARLRLEREALRAPDHLAPLAASMGLVEPRADRIWRVAPDGTVSVASVLPAPPVPPAKVGLKAAAPKPVSPPTPLAAPAAARAAAAAPAAAPVPAPAPVPAAAAAPAPAPVPAAAEAPAKRRKTP